MSCASAAYAVVFRTAYNIADGLRVGWQRPLRSYRLGGVPLPPGAIIEAIVAFDGPTIWAESSSSSEDAQRAGVTVLLSDLGEGELLKIDLYGYCRQLRDMLSPQPVTNREWHTPPGELGPASALLFPEHRLLLLSQELTELLAGARSVRRGEEEPPAPVKIWAWKGLKGPEYAHVQGCGAAAALLTEEQNDLLLSGGDDDD